MPKHILIATEPGRVSIIISEQPLVANLWTIFVHTVFVFVVSVSASHTLGRGFASRQGHTKDHHKNGTNCLPAWHAMR